MTEAGYTGPGGKYQPAGIVHRGEFTYHCSCGGGVRAYWDGEIISHTSPFDPSATHRSGGFLGPELIELWMPEETK